MNALIFWAAGASPSELMAHSTPAFLPMSFLYSLLPQSSESQSHRVALSEGMDLPQATLAVLSVVWDQDIPSLKL